MVLEDDLPFENNLQYRLDCEREKADVLRPVCGRPPNSITTSGRTRPPSAIIPPTPSAKTGRSRRMRCSAFTPSRPRQPPPADAAKQTTPESPDASISAAITVRGEKTLCRISIRTLWSRESIRKMIGVVGYVVPVGADHSRRPGAQPPHGQHHRPAGAGRSHMNCSSILTRSASSPRKPMAFIN